MSNDPTPHGIADDQTPVDPTATWSSPMDLPFVDPPQTADASDATTTLPVEDAGYAATAAYLPAPVLRGPSPWTVILGLVGLFVAVLVFLTTATTVRIDWTTAGPVAVVGFGGVLVLLGLLGMLGRRRTTH